MSTIRYVIVGKVIKHEAISDKGTTSIDSNLGGFVYTVAIQERLCREEDFVTKVHHALELFSEVQIFVPYKLLARGKQHLVLDQRYLLFLVEPDKEQQNQ